MSKTTNYEISKKLAEIGFKVETGFYWYEYDKGEEMRYIADADGAGKYKAYDLETMLDALPEEREYAYFRMSKNGFWYEEWNYPKQSYYYIEKLENESLADTAGRMLILLESKNLISFKNA
jgi:hypothetical protein